MTRYLMRLDDASPFYDKTKWGRIEQLLDRYKVTPIVGIIPNNRDPSLLRNEYDQEFWEMARKWQEKSWCLALHGYDHRYRNTEGGINPVNKKSEFAGLTLGEQEEKIAEGISILENQGIIPRVFFAPAHTFDKNTLQALRNKSNIRIISDTIANDVYSSHGFFFIPQQAGSVRRLPFKTVTFCYHPNSMNETDFSRLNSFLAKHQRLFVGVEKIEFKIRSKTPFDLLLNFIYMNFRCLLR